MNAHLNITVGGTVMSGKTTVSQLIANALNQHGVPVEIIDQDGDIPSLNANDIAERMRMLVVNRDLHVTIRQQPLQRGGISKDMEHG